MIRKRYISLILVLFVFLVVALQSPAQDEISNKSRPSSDEMAALTGAEPTKTIGEQILDVVGDDSVVVRSEDGRTVLMMEGEPDDEFTLSFSSVKDGVLAHVKLGKGGLKHRFTLVKPKGGDDTPIYLDIKGPAVNGGYGVKVTLRF